ncbi:MAG: hypothetical protein HND54_08790 [Bacteroidetes bacterium]|nr:hypothetical protein [Bacteroidota bacterium]
MLKRLVFLLSFISALSIRAGNPDLFYFISDANDRLYSINRTTGTVTLIGSTGVTNIEAIAYYPIPSANKLFATNGGDFGTLNMSTGAFTLIAEVDGGGTANGSAGPQTLNDIDGLMLDGRTFKLWASERNSGSTPDLIFQINPNTGRFVPNAFGPGIDYLEVAGPGIEVDVDDIAISPVTGRMYASSNFNGTNDQLIAINKFTGVFSVQVVLTEDDIEGLAFSNDGTLYGSEGDGDNRLGEININTGVVSNFHSFSPGSDVEGLASLVADANTLSGTVYNDVNYNGIKEGGELGVANVRVYLYMDNNSNGLVDPEDTRIQSALTDGNGDYSFYFASTGNLLTSTQYSSYPYGYALTTDNVETSSFTDDVNFGETDTGNNFGIASGPDCDGDGIPNFFETGRDSDLDMIPDSCDLDSDNDGIRDDIEGIEDFDDDGIPDYRDRDSDDDGIPDAIEANAGIAPSGYNANDGNISGADVDGNGIIDTRETFSGSGIMLSPNPDSDNDGHKDYRDLDSDNDGILDIIEAGGVDTDYDGQVDGVTDLNNDGYSDLLSNNPLSIPNTDATYETTNGLSLKPNYIDIDSDADGIDDTREGYSTANYNFPTLIMDSDEDGIIDFWDVSTFSSPITPYDRDGDGIPDYIDLDSDNDGVSDFIEGNDADANGVADLANSGNDDNGNGLDDAFDSGCANVIYAATGDYAEQNNTNGSINLSSSDLELVNESANQTVGVLFGNVDIDQGVTVNSAYIQFETDETSTGAIAIKIEGQLSSNPSLFTSTAYNVSTRPRTTANVTWNPANWNTVGEAGAAQLTVDISSIVQEIVNQGAWTSGNNMVFIFTGPSGNTRIAEVDPTLIINTDAIVCVSNVAHQDFDGDGEDDFRDVDDDADGIPTIAEIPDNDGSGTPDYLEFDGDECGLGLLRTGYTNNYTGALQSQSGVTNSGNILSTPNNTVARFDSNNDEYVMDFGEIFPAGYKYIITWRERTGRTGTATIVLAESEDNSTFNNRPVFPATNSTTLFNDTITSLNNFRYLRFRLENTTSSTHFEIDAVGVLEPICDTDSDNDGILDADDIDDDNDGILDTDEAASCRGFLDYDFYDGTPSGYTVDNIPTSGELASGTVSNFDVDAIQNSSDPGDADTYGIRFSGYITISTSETYTFYTTSDDGSKLYVNGTEVVDNDGLHSSTEVSGTIALTPGTYSFVVEFFENTGDDNLSVSYSSPSISKMLLPFSVLSNSNSACDTDKDGVENRLDLDSDNDGIADIIEAGGVDLDNNGRVDSYADGDNDGWANTFDSDNGGTALTDPDTDVDNLQDRIDIDADDDGIVDVIEAQVSSSNPILPSGTDSDGDGIDDNFDMDLGANLLVPVNTDGADNPDYIDTDSDNDGDLDILEAWDTNNDGIANTNPSGVDSDNDGLDDSFDDVVGLNSSSNVSNNNQTSDSFPDLDNPFTPERDWREFLDSDNDGIANKYDIDDDNDGILDVDENLGCLSGITQSLYYEFYDVKPSGNTVDNIPTSGATGTGSVTSIDVDALYAIETPGDGNLFSIRYTGFITISTNETYTFYTTSDDGSKLYIDGNQIVNNDGNHGVQERSGTVALTKGTYPITILFYEDGGGEFLSVSYSSGSIAKTTIPFSVFSEVSQCDTDGDGIPNQIDLDSDNDGIPDIIEAGGVDIDGDGRVDGEFNDGNNNDGWSNVFDDQDGSGGTPLADPDQDGDGYKNRIDLDADNDGIADIIEAGGIDADGNGMADSNTDDNFNGWANTYDHTEAGENLPIVDTDGDGISNYLDLDSDSDGINDNVEGQTTAGFLAPLGLDTDQDGWDNRYDSDDGGTAITLSNNDATGNPDYMDDDSDGDTFPDWIEGFDDDEDGDALNDLLARADTYESSNGNPLLYVNAFDANGTNDGDGIPDWLEDDDLDGIPNYLDPDYAGYSDQDLDGLIDLFDTDNGGIPAGLSDQDGDGEYDFRDTDNEVTLPIELVYFTAIKEDAFVRLDWETSTEINNDYFTIERSINGIDFETLLIEKGAGNSNKPIVYQRFDKNPITGSNYYRLKQTDFNGDYKYFKVQMVNFKKGNTSDYSSKGIGIYPNPTNGEQLRLVIDLIRKGSFSYEILATDGKQLFYKSLVISEEMENFQIDVLEKSVLDSGAYILKVYFNQDVVNLPFIIL